LWINNLKPGDVTVNVGNARDGTEDDFDNDGYTNKQEAEAGTDLTDPDSYPAGGEIEIYEGIPDEGFYCMLEVVGGNPVQVGETVRALSFYDKVPVDIDLGSSFNGHGCTGTDNSLTPINYTLAVDGKEYNVDVLQQELDSTINSINSFVFHTVDGKMVVDQCCQDIPWELSEPEISGTPGLNKYGLSILAAIMAGAGAYGFQRKNKNSLENKVI